MPMINRYNVFKPEDDFLAIPDHYVNVVGFIPFEDLPSLAMTDLDGNAIIKRGTVVKMDGTGKVGPSMGVGNGIIFHTIKVDKYQAIDEKVTVTVMVHGFVRKDRLIDGDSLTQNANIWMVNR